MGKGQTLGAVGIKVTADTSKHDKAIDNSEKKVKDFSSNTKARLDIAGTAWLNFGNVVTGVASTYALTRLAQETNRVGMEFKASMQSVAAYSRATEGQLGKLEEAARQVGANTEKSSTQAAQGLKYLSMAGYEVYQSIEALPGIVDLSTAAEMDLALAADIVSDGMTAMGLEVDQTTRMLDVMAAVSSRSNTDITMMGEAFKYSAPMARSYGYEIEDLTAYLGTLATAGLKGSLAGTSLARAFSLTEKAAKELGIEGADLITVVRELNRQQTSNTEITQMFGMYAAKSVMNLQNLVWKFDQLKDSAKDSGGELAKMAGVIRDSLKNDFTILSSTLESIALAFFDKYEDMARRSVQKMTEFARKFKDLIEGGKGISGLSGIDAQIAQVEARIKELTDTRIQEEKRAANAIRAAQAIPGRGSAILTTSNRDISSLSEQIAKQKQFLAGAEEISKEAGKTAEQKLLEKLEAEKLYLIDLKRAKQAQQFREDMEEDRQRGETYAAKTAMAKEKEAEAVKKVTDETKLQQATLDAIYQKQAQYLQQFEGNNGFLTLEIDGETFRVTEAELDNLLKGLDKVKKEAEKTGISFGDMLDELKSAGKGATSEFLTDALRGELESFDDYMGSFVNSLQSAWADMVAKMIIEWQAIGNLSMAGSFGVMGLIGGGLALAGGLFGGKDKGPSEHEKALEEWGRSLDKINDRLAELSMSDADYKLYQLNQQMAEYAAQAANARQSTEKLVELRKAETAAIIEQTRQQYTDINTAVDAWLEDLERSSWSTEDWQLRFNQIGDELAALNPSASDYEDKSLDLLNEQFDVLKQIYGVQSEYLDLYKDAQRSVNDKIWELSNGSGAPTSAQNYQARYDSLLAAANSGDSGAVSDLLSYIPSYMSAMGSAGANTATLRQGVISDLSGLSLSLGDLSDQAAQDATSTASSGIGSISDAAGDIQGGANDAASEMARKEWLAAEPKMNYSQGDFGYRSMGWNYFMLYGDNSLNQDDFKYVDNKYVHSDKYGYQWVAPDGTYFAGIQGLTKNVYMPALEGWILGGLESGVVTQGEADSWLPWIRNFPGVPNGQFDGDTVLKQAMAHFRNKPSDFPVPVWANTKFFARGGLSYEPAIFAEAGPEWAVPAYNNANNANFLKSVGADPARIAAEIVKRTGGGGGQGPIIIQLHMDGRKTAEVVVDQIRKNGRIKRAYAKELA